MKMSERKTSLFEQSSLARSLGGRFLATSDVSIATSALGQNTVFVDGVETIRNKSVLIHLQSQLSVALALIELDGLARQIFLCPPDISISTLKEAAFEAQCDIVLTDTWAEAARLGIPRKLCSKSPLVPRCHSVRDIKTEWVLFTSGTTGRPKQVTHTLQSLTASLQDGAAITPGAVWSSFYDIRRYGGLQIFLRALLTGGSMLFTGPHEPISSFLSRAGAYGITHISGTPSHWRQVLMSGSADKISPSYIRLSGEIVDQGILDKLSDCYPDASIAHAFASTEAGVAFDVRDGFAGFPASFLERSEATVSLKISNGTLHIRSARMAQKYAGTARTLQDEDGFVDTGDLVEIHNGRCHFIGRKQGVINVGGLKVYPEEVETVLNQHPAVEMSLVHGRRNPIVGALIVADIIVRPSYLASGGSFATLKSELFTKCRQVFPPHKVPVALREVASLKIANSGKILRNHA